MADYSARMRQQGFHVLNYFNVTEFGAHIAFPQPARVAHNDADLWKDPNDWLYGRLRSSLLLAPLLLRRLGEENAFPLQRGAEHLRVVRVADPVDLFATRDEQPAIDEDGHRLHPHVANALGAFGFELEVVLGGEEHLFHAGEAGQHLAGAVVAEAVHALLHRSVEDRTQALPFGVGRGG